MGLLHVTVGVGLLHVHAAMGGGAAHAKLAGGFRAECHFLSLFQFSFSTSSLPNPSLSILKAKESQTRDLHNPL